jgi:hypothetical protein
MIVEGKQKSRGWGDEQKSEKRKGKQRKFIESSGPGGLYRHEAHRLVAFRWITVGGNKNWKP